MTTGTLQDDGAAALSLPVRRMKATRGAGPVPGQGRGHCGREVGKKAHHRCPAVAARFFAPDGWGARLSEEVTGAERRDRGGTGTGFGPVIPGRAWCPASTRPGLCMLGDGRLEATYQQNRRSGHRLYANNQGDFGPMQGQVHGNAFQGRAASQVFQGVFCDFVPEVGGGARRSRAI